MIDLRIEAEVVIGNECADALAKRGADLGKISLQRRLRHQMGGQGSWVDTQEAHLHTAACMRGARWQ